MNQKQQKALKKRGRERENEKERERSKFTRGGLGWQRKGEWVGGGGEEAIFIMLKKGMAINFTSIPFFENWVSLPNYTQAVSQ